MGADDSSDCLVCFCSSQTLLLLAVLDDMTATRVGAGPSICSTSCPSDSVPQFFANPGPRPMQRAANGRPLPPAPCRNLVIRLDFFFSPGPGVFVCSSTTSRSLVRLMQRRGVYSATSSQGFARPGTISRAAATWSSTSGLGPAAWANPSVVLWCVRQPCKVVMLLDYTH